VQLIKIFIAGWGILVVAIFFKILVSRLGIDTWFGLSEEVKKVGFAKALQNESFVEILFSL